NLAHAVHVHVGKIPHRAQENEHFKPLPVHDSAPRRYHEFTSTERLTVGFVRLIVRTNRDGCEERGPFVISEWSRHVRAPAVKDGIRGKQNLRQGSTYHTLDTASRRKVSEDCNYYTTY